MILPYGCPMCRSAVVLLCIVYLLIPLCATADFYKYHDESGGVSVTNDYNSVPERYRAGVTVVKESDLLKKSQNREKQVRDESVGADKQRRSGGIEKQNQMSLESPSSVPSKISEKAVESSPSITSPGWFDRQLPLLKIAALIALLIAFAVVAGKLISSVVPKTLGLIIKIALLVGVIVYVFNAYGQGSQSLCYY